MNADASSNPNLFVSAENSQFNNHFSGSMVIEVIVLDPNLSKQDDALGEPDVTLNGQSLRMVQATDGNWYAYFANIDKAKAADSTVGLAGKGLDFGVFCSKDTLSTVFGISLSNTDGFAVPRSAGLTSFTDGTSSFSACTGSPTSSENLNNVVRNPKSINKNSNVPTGQIGLNSNAWPLIQLFSFNSGVTLQYNPAGPSQKVSLEYDEIPNIAFTVDRVLYPKNAAVFLTVNDFQLNQDPTDKDSWTFDIDSNPSMFYQAFDASGTSSANGGVGLVNLIPHLSNLGFENNGKLTVNLGSVIELKSNNEQPTISVSDSSQIFSEVLTLVETRPNSGIFDNADQSDQSTMKILNNAPRGGTGSVTYNKESLSILTGSSTASVSLTPELTIGEGSSSLKPGTKYPITLTDPDQNFNSGVRDKLEIFSDTSIIPTLKIGNPITLKKASNVNFFTLATDLLTTGKSAISSISDPHSSRLVIDTSSVTNGSFEKISLNLGITASELQSLFIDTSLETSEGTNWLNYDLRSFENDFGISNFSDTSMELSFGSLGSLPVTIIDSGDISSAKGLIQLDDATVKSIFDKSGTVFLLITFESIGTGTISNESNSQPIVIDFFSFGANNSNDVNNAIYRFELEETSDNSSFFDGIVEYAVTNQLNLTDPQFIQTIQTNGDKIKFIVTDRLVDEKGISISYSDLDDVGFFTTTSTKTNLKTTSGILLTDSKSYRFGQPVTITLNDPDLNLKNDLIDTYFVINDPNSENVDTVGNNGEILLEILFKDIRYKRCTINGIEYGGLGNSGFTLVETGTKTGIFEGLIKIPTTICSKSGTELISTAGGNLDVKYYDSKDEFGKPNIFSLLKKPSASLISENIEKSNFEMPDWIKNNAKWWSSSTISDSEFINGIEHLIEKNIIVIAPSERSPVNDQKIPNWIKNNAKWWSENLISDEDFVKSIQYLVTKGIIRV